MRADSHTQSSMCRDERFFWSRGEFPRFACWSGPLSAIHRAKRAAIASNVGVFDLFSLFLGLRHTKKISLASFGSGTLTWNENSSDSVYFDRESCSSL